MLISNYWNSEYSGQCCEEKKEKKMKRTVKFFASLGVVAGYGHNNAPKNWWIKIFCHRTPAESIAGKAWQTAAAAVMAASGTYVGAVITAARTVYHTDWGCPVGGETTVLITGECNPEYTEMAAYKTAVIETLRQAALALGQSTTQLTFSEVEFEYLDFRPKSE